MALSKEEVERRKNLFQRGIKICCTCQKEMTLDKFGKKQTTKDGLQPRCKQCRSEKQKSNRPKITEANKKYQYTDANRARRRQRWAMRNEQQKEDDRKYSAEYHRKRKQKDPIYKLKCRVSTTIWKALTSNNGSKAGESILQHLPYSIQQLKTHLEEQFLEGMSWKNYGEWHIDHIYPQSRLPYDSFYHPNFLECWKLENLQPLWAKENIKKSNKLLDK